MLYIKVNFESERKVSIIYWVRVKINGKIKDDSK